MNDSRKMSMEAMMAKLLKRVESTNGSVKEINSYFSTMTQIVDSHSTLIKHFEHWWDSCQQPSTSANWYNLKYKK